MNKWSLLLLALVAVIQPIASFTERNFVDGRQQCCDRESRSLLRDSRETLHGTNRLTKRTSAERRLNQRDEIRGDRRHEMKYDVVSISRPSTDTSLLRVRDIEPRKRTVQSLARSARTENRLERITDKYNRIRIQSRDENTRSLRTSRDIQPDEQSRRVVRENLLNQNVRIAETHSSRNRYIAKINRNNEPSDFALESRHESRRIHIRSSELRRASPNRELRNEVRQKRDNVARHHEDASDASSIRRQAVSNRLNVVRREHSVRVEVKTNFDNNNERRVAERENVDRRLEVSDIRAVHENRLQKRDTQKENRESIHLPNPRSRMSQQFDERRYQRQEDGLFKHRINSIRPSSLDRTQVKENKMRKFDSLKRVIDETSAQFVRNNENQRELREVATRVTENRGKTIRSSLREIRDNEQRFSLRRSESLRDINKIEREIHAETIRANRRAMRDDGRRFKETLNVNRREIRDHERLARGSQGEVRNTETTIDNHRDSRDDERRFKARINGKQRESQYMERSFRQITNEKLGDISRPERRSRNRDTESRTEIRSSETIRRHREIREPERRFRESSDRRREIRTTETMGAIRETREYKRRFRENRNGERRLAKIQKERITENRRQIRETESRFRDRSNESRMEIREAENHSRDKSSETRREIRATETMGGDKRESRADERRFRENRNGKRRLAEIQKERVTENRRKTTESARRSSDRSSESQMKIRSTETIRGSRREITEAERRPIDRSSESRGDIRSTETMKDKREIRKGEERFRENRNGERRLGEIQEERITENRRQFRETERRSRDRSSESRGEINRENKRETREDERLFSGNTNGEKRSARSLKERITENRIQIRETERRSRDRNNEISTEIREARRDRDDGEGENRFSKNRSDQRLLIERQEGNSRVNQRQIRGNERRSRERNSDTRRVFRSTERTMETRDNEKRSKDNRDVKREIRDNEMGFRQSKTADDRRSTNVHRPDSRIDNKGLERNNVMLERRARSLKQRNARDHTSVREHNRSAEVSRERDISHVPIKFLTSNDKTMDKESIDMRIRNVESARNRDNLESTIPKDKEAVQETIIANWQYVFYTLQGIYLCGLIAQVLTPSNSEKSKTGNWWNIHSQRLIKMD